MSIRPKLRNAALLGAIAAVAVSAWAANEITASSTGPDYRTERQSVTISEPMVEREIVAVESEPIAVERTLSPNESIVVEREVAAVPVVERSTEAIIVEEPRLTEDQRIQAEVMDRLANSRRISGQIGVESHAAVVTLTGWTPTAAQARHAEREASGVAGVDYVKNFIRPRVGGTA